MSGESQGLIAKGTPIKGAGTDYGTELKEQGHGHAHGATPCSGHGGGHGAEHGGGHGGGHAEHGDHGDHGHSHGGEEAADTQANVPKLLRAVVICFIFMLVEVVGGLLAGSLAIITDAAHLMADTAGMAISVAAIKLASRAASDEFSFGWARAEVLGAMVSVMLIWAITAILLYEAIRRLIQPQEVDGELMFIIACIGLFVNCLMLFVLGGHDHAHGGGGCEHGHGEDGDINVLAAQIHVLGDLVQTIGVIIASVLIWWKPFDVGMHAGVNAWYLADPICTIIFACLVMLTTYNIMRESLDVLMMKTPSNANVEELKSKLISIDDVVEVHDVHVWAVTRGKWVMGCHLRVEHAEHTNVDQQCCVADEILEKAQSIAKELGMWHTTIQIEHQGGHDCHPCDEPRRDDITKGSFSGYDKAHTREHTGHGHAAQAHGHQAHNASAGHGHAH